MNAHFRNGTVYAKSARFDVARALTEDEMRREAPSIFAMVPHESRSERFRAIPTIEVLRALAKEGFHPVGVKQSVARAVESYRVGDTVCEMLLKNANDGTSAYDLMAGLFRIACMNSLVSQTSTLDSVKVRHSGEVTHKVIEGTYRVLGEAQKTLAAPQDWAQKQLAREEREIFAEAAHVLRFGDAAGDVATPIAPRQLLSPRRRDDTANDLWTTFNVVQENVIRGGLTGINRIPGNRPRRVTTRAVNGIDQDVKLNKALWVLAEGMAKLKAA